MILSSKACGLDSWALQVFNLQALHWKSSVWIHLYVSFLWKNGDFLLPGSTAREQAVFAVVSSGKILHFIAKNVFIGESVNQC